MLKTLAKIDYVWLTVSRIVVAGSVALTLTETPVGSVDPFALSTVARLSDPDARTRLDRGAAVIDVLPARDRDLVVFGAVRTNAHSDRLVAWTRRIDALHKGPYVPVAVRFSDPPRIDDLETLQLAKSDLDDLRRCRPGDCGLKLGADEIDRLRCAMSKSGNDWQRAAQAQFRQIMLDRTVQYLAAGYDSTPPYADRHTPVPPGIEFELVSDRMRDSSLHAPDLMEYLERYPRGARADVESFLYWSTEVLGSGKPITSITHVAIVRGDDPAHPEALVASKQIFATHYLSASLSLTAVTRASADGHRYLLYTRRSRVDLFHGALAGIVRRMVEKRIRSDAPAVLEAMKHRLEAGDPPHLATSTR
jgi:hypothetical protein